MKLEDVNGKVIIMNNNNSVGWIIVFLIGFSQSVSAQLASSDGSLRLTWLGPYEESCSTGEPQGSYTTSNGVHGLLYPTDCDNATSSGGGDSAYYRFTDTEGSERCVGSASMSFNPGPPKTANTTWKIEGAVSGYQCSTIGNRYSIVLYYTQ